ncbi:MAG: leucyl aminopeptidase [Candidatus Omnitrophica bacterium]|nr:leucyl aminopeptidase [Candidatus Omnitrophota bacterium]
MKFRPTAQFDQEAAILFLEKKRWPEQILALKKLALSADIRNLFDSGLFTADHGQIFPLRQDKQIILCVGIDASTPNLLTALRCVTRQAVRSSYIAKIKNVEIIPLETAIPTLIAHLEGALIGGYTWRKYLTRGKADKTVYDKNFIFAAAAHPDLSTAVTICENVNFSRDLINDNADTITADFFEKTIRAVTKTQKNISLEILGRKELIAQGLNLHLAVNQGSRKEPKLIIVRYQGADAKEKFTALVGKGLTFDSGGLNLKPTGSMETMREDMSGAAAVLGALKNTLALRLKKNILFVCGMAENAIGSGAYKPGDVIRGYSGKTVEVANTDAEGRLVLADALAYISKNYQPQTIIDIATLTGACRVALGDDYSGLVATDSALAEALQKIADKTDDRVWRLPHYPELKEAVKSKIADIKNTGFPKGAAGAITAAEFLRQFVGADIRWAHLDIAGTAFVETGERLYFNYGATGAGVRLLTHFLMSNDPKF